MERITEKMLQRQVDRINTLTGSPATPYTQRPDGSFVANIGNFHLSHAYGGVSLERMIGEGGGVQTPLNTGHISKRDLHGRLAALIIGLGMRNEC